MRWLLGAVSLTLALAGCTLSDLAPGSQEVERGVEPRAPGADVGGWNIRVSVEPSRVSQLVATVGSARAAPRNDMGGFVARGWVTHDLALENVGRRILHLTGARSNVAFIGPAGHRRRLLATGPICGYVPRQSGPGLTTACLAVLDATDLKPGASQVIPIALTKGLRGMEPLVAGTYVFGVRFRLRAPASGDANVVAFEIVYEIQRTGTNP